jgi:aminocarboxymuconate-semialdehyde decarboxylase
VSGLIDVHGHIVLEGSMGTAGWCGPEIGTHDDGTAWFRVGNYQLDGVAYRGSLFIETDLRLAAMDEQGIRVQALSPNPLTYLHFIDAPLAVDFCRAHNDDLAETVRAHPDRFVGLGALPMQDIGAACEELTRIVTDLGLLGGYIGTDFGTDLDDSGLDELYATCVELDVPLFMHPCQSGIDGPLRDRRLRKWDLDLVLEYSFEEMVATATLVFGGVTRRHPDLDICLSHGGGSTPLAMSKLRKLAERRPASPEWIKEPGAFDEHYRRLWFDCHVTGGREFDFVISQIGTDRLVYGTNFGGWDRGTGADVTNYTDTLNANAARLLRLDRRAPHLLEG